MHFRGSNSAIFKLCHPCQRVQLLLKVQNIPLALLWKGFVNWGRKEEVNEKLFPFVKMAGKKPTWFTQTTTLIKLYEVLLQSGAI